jgi:hypothetical protein
MDIAAAIIAVGWSERWRPIRDDPLRQNWGSRLAGIAKLSDANKLNAIVETAPRRSWQ